MTWLKLTKASSGRTIRFKEKQMTFSTNYKPFMTYLMPKDIVRLKRFSKFNKIPMAQVIREGLEARLSSGNQYTNGFNAGLIKAVNVVESMEAAQMRFPSGKSFFELIEQEISKNIIREEVEDEAHGKT
jgi:hypothetical protein